MNEYIRIWGYRLNQMTSWRHDEPELLAQAENWGFSDDVAADMVRAAMAMTQENCCQSSLAEKVLDMV